ncbi:MAG TPA: hotdog fold domain-containing protein [Steroidobacteraceae bacterium]|nr:hotdog fold domain-containing protein [Steroidobacteraceae bacterium]HRX90531.1 hotdog fold domain-containing protein [Steroidobacteraceae bacterium]
MNPGSPIPATLRAWQRAERHAFGRWLFARTVCRRAPYFATIRPQFLELAPSVCRVAMQKRRAVENHIHTVHALAMGNLCELAAGLCTEVTIPVTMRWIPRSMSIDYLAKAATNVTATARLTTTAWSRATNVDVQVSVHDEQAHEVVRASIAMYVSPRKSAPTHT